MKTTIYTGIFSFMTLIAANTQLQARYLREFPETVPNNKIMAFGGDGRYVKETFGDAIIARQIVAGCLAEMVGDGYLSEQEAIKVAGKILRENAIGFNNLEYYFF